MEDLTIRRRNRLKHHYTLTSNVLLFGYRTLSDSAKLTYQVIDSYDWEDRQGKRKGFAYPTLARLASDRGVDERTIRRHIGELEKVRLLTRSVRPGRPNVLVIEDPGREETREYLRRYGGESGEDKDVRGTPDKNVRPLLKEDKEQERQTLVNEDGNTWEEGEDLAGVEDLVRKRVALLHVRRSRAPEEKAKREYLAQQIMEVLGDEHSLGFYRKVAETVPDHKVFEAMSEVRLAGREGRVRTSKAAMFASIVKDGLTRD